jgi:hypothetical protein
MTYLSRLCNAFFLLIFYAIPIIRSQRDELNNMAITGWYHSCQESSLDRCLGQRYTQLSVPLYLELDTCYVNPYAKSSSSLTFYRYNSHGVVIEFSVIFPVQSQGHMPQSCDRRGACVCTDMFLSLQESWGNNCNSTMMKFSYKCKSRPANFSCVSRSDLKCYVPNDLTFPVEPSQMECSMLASLESLNKPTRDIFDTSSVPIEANISSHDATTIVPNVFSNGRYHSSQENQTGVSIHSLPTIRPGLERDYNNSNAPTSVEWKQSYQPSVLQNEVKENISDSVISETIANSISPTPSIIYEDNAHHESAAEGIIANSLTILFLIIICLLIIRCFMTKTMHNLICQKRNGDMERTLAIRSNQGGDTSLQPEDVFRLEGIVDETVTSSSTQDGMMSLHSQNNMALLECIGDHDDNSNDYPFLFVDSTDDDLEDNKRIQDDDQTTTTDMTNNIRFNLATTLLSSKIIPSTTASFLPREMSSIHLAPWIPQPFRRSDLLRLDDFGESHCSSSCATSTTGSYNKFAAVTEASRSISVKSPCRTSRISVQGHNLVWYNMKTDTWTMTGK